MEVGSKAISGGEFKHVVAPASGEHSRFVSIPVGLPVMNLGTMIVVEFVNC